MHGRPIISIYRGQEVHRNERNVTSNHNVPAPAGPAVLNEPLRNRGVAFTLAEREALGNPGSGGIVLAVARLSGWPASTAVAVLAPRTAPGPARR